MREGERIALHNKYRSLFGEQLVNEKNNLFLKWVSGYITHEEYRVYETLEEITDILLELNDYLYASKNDKVIVYTKKKAIE